MKALMNRLPLVTSALNPIKSRRIESSQGISEGGLTGCPNHPKRKRINSRLDFFWWPDSAPEPFLQKHFGEPAPSVWLVLLSPGPGWLNPIAANHGESPQRCRQKIVRGSESLP